MDKNWPGLLIVVALAIFSCEDASDIGLGLDPDGVRVNVLYEELPLAATNVRIDSIRTSNSSRLLIGKYADPIFGTTVSTALSQINLTNTLSGLSGDDHYYVVDSTVINLNINKAHTDDISNVQSFTVYQLTDTIFTSGYYLSDFITNYRTDESFGNFDIKLSASSLNLIDEKNYLVQKKLSASLGDELFAIANGQKGNSVSPSGALRYEFKGIAIVGDAANNVLLDIDHVDSTNIRVHYHVVDPYTEDGNSLDSVLVDSLFLNYSLGSNGAYYNQISTDRSGSLMSSETGNYNGFTTGDGNIYLQPASGIFPKLNFDALNQFFAANPNIQINRMEFSIETKENSAYNSNVGNFRFLYVDQADGSKINTNGLLTNILGETAILSDAGYISGSSEPLIASLDETSLTYTGVPTFFAQLVETGSIEVDHIILVPQDVTTPDFSVFDEETGFIIKLYYTLPE
ncbi:DUF4270 family protein [Reichenbachiella faecimaris]|uniref:DUF4270 family protein n=1 Tax=Reichenbachiella faecimaris TaxID=692418 RepID=UPI0015943A07|nr:DUF4270 family protein [Reichenbachiella faecimaris]